jgi:hypothetical protein
MRICSLLACLFFAITLSSAQPADKVALVLGNSAYAVKPLVNPRNDAQDISRALTELGFSVELLIDGNQKATKRAIQHLGERAKGARAALFYYAGHAVQVQGTNWLIPVDAEIAKASDIELEAVPLDSVMAQLNDAGAKTNLIFLDACRDNPFPSASRSAARGLSIVANVPSGSLIAFATAPGQTAADGDGRNGLFTQALLSKIRTPGLSISELLMQVRLEVQTKSGGSQVPWDSSCLTSAFYFKPGQPPKEGNVARGAQPFTVLDPSTPIKADSISGREPSRYICTTGILDFSSAPRVWKPGKAGWSPAAASDLRARDYSPGPYAILLDDRRIEMEHKFAGYSSGNEYLINTVAKLQIFNRSNNERALSISAMTDGYAQKPEYIEKYSRLGGRTVTMYGEPGGPIRELDSDGNPIEKKLDTAEALDPFLFYPAQTMCMAQVGNRLYFIKGDWILDWSTTIHHTTDCLDLDGYTFTHFPGSPTRRGGFSTIVINDQIWVIGGEYENKVLPDVQAFLTKGNTWSSLAPLGVARKLPLMVKNKGQVYALGGQDAEGHSLAAVERYDEASGTWIRLADLPSPVNAAEYMAIGTQLVNRAMIPPLPK